MCERKRSCAKRPRPNVPLTLRLDLAEADTVARIAEETGEAVSAVLEKLVLYALSRVRLTEVTRKEMQFSEAPPMTSAGTTSFRGGEEHE